MQSALSIRSHKKFYKSAMYTTIMILPRFIKQHSYKSTKDPENCSWSPCICLQSCVSPCISRRAATMDNRCCHHMQCEGHNVHDDFAVAILKYSNTACRSCTTGHFQEAAGISCRRVAARLVLVLQCNILSTCNFDIPEDTHQGR